MRAALPHLGEKAQLDALLKVCGEWPRFAQASNAAPPFAAHRIVARHATYPHAILGSSGSLSLSALERHPLPLGCRATRPMISRAAPSSSSFRFSSASAGKLGPSSAPGGRLLSAGRSSPRPRKTFPKFKV